MPNCVVRIVQTVGPYKSRSDHHGRYMYEIEASNTQNKDFSRQNLRTCWRRLLDVSDSDAHLKSQAKPGPETRP